MTECLSCKNEFYPRHKLHVYCSSSCRDRVRRSRRPKGSMAEYNREWRASQSSKASDPAYVRNYHLTRNFGITLTEYEEILETQGGGCAVCSRTPEQEGRALAVDHDHTTGEIYGILCWMCNHKIIGRNRDPKFYSGIARYLSKGIGKFVPREPNVPELK